jgi:integrase
VLFALKAILADAQRRGLVACNAAQPVRIDTRKRRQKKLEIGIEIPGKGRHPETVNRRFRPLPALLVTAIFTAPRNCAASPGVPWTSAGRRSRCVNQRADAGGTIDMPKSAAGQREIPMSPIVLNTLRKWKLQCPKGQLDLVFANGAGNVQALSDLIR